jgi:hypothetical protein|tara:strand:+ start:1045 stop:1227 length:183 start_codon:yes stop_codon:yes gene_type:complete
MTDITRYKNVSLSKETYKDIQTLSKEIFDVPLSLSKTIEFLAKDKIRKIKKAAEANGKIK